MAGYQRRNTGMSDEEVQRRISQARAKAAGNGSPRADGEMDAPFSAPREWHAEMAEGDAVALKRVPELKGAVKVERFPEKSKYPFRQIADDGGIWKLDPAAFNAKAVSIYQAALKRARDNDRTPKCVQSDGAVYVQFKAGAS